MKNCMSKTFLFLCATSQLIFRRKMAKNLDNWLGFLSVFRSPVQLNIAENSSHVYLKLYRILCSTWHSILRNCYGHIWVVGMFKGTTGRCDVERWRRSETANNCIRRTFTYFSMCNRKVQVVNCHERRVISNICNQHDGLIKP